MMYAPVASDHGARKPAPSVPHAASAKEKQRTSLALQAERRAAHLNELRSLTLSEGFNPALLRQLFRAFDADNDQEVTHAELQAGLISRMQTLHR